MFNEQKMEKVNGNGSINGNGDHWAEENQESNAYPMENASGTPAELQERWDEFIREAIPHVRLLYNFAYKMLGNRDDAEDLVQDTYMRAYRFFDSFEKGTNCKAWMFRIMKNLFINKYKKDQREAAVVDYGDVENFVDSIQSLKLDSNDLQQRIFSKLLDDEVTDALNSIQEDFKVAVILCDLEGLSYEEIAEFLHCPIGTVRSRLHRGRRLLQKKLLRYARERGYNVVNL